MQRRHNDYIYQRNNVFDSRFKGAYTHKPFSTEHVFEMNFKLFKAHHSNPKTFFIFECGYEPGPNIKNGCDAL